MDCLSYYLHDLQIQVGVVPEKWTVKLAPSTRLLSYMFCWLSTLVMKIIFIYFVL